MNTELYANTPAVGLLKGFSPMPHQLEVDVVVPHHERGLPGFGEFLLVELSATEALVEGVPKVLATNWIGGGCADISRLVGDGASVRVST